MKLLTFNSRFFIVSLALTCLLTFVAFLGVMINDQANTTSSFIFSVLFKFFRFPTHTLAFNFFNQATIFYFFGLFINCIIYSLLTERLFSLIRNKSK